MRIRNNKGKERLVFNIDRQNKVRLIAVNGVPLYGRIGKYSSLSKARRKVAWICNLNESEQDKYINAVYVKVHEDLLPILTKRLDTHEPLTKAEQATLNTFREYIIIRLQHYRIIGSNGFTSKSYLIKSYAEKQVDALKLGGGSFIVEETVKKYHKINKRECESWKDLATECLSIPSESREGTEWIFGVGKGYYQPLGSATKRDWCKAWMFDTGWDKRPKVQRYLDKLKGKTKVIIPQTSTIPYWH